MPTWYPDFCPDDAQGRAQSCEISLSSDWSSVQSYSKKCSHHAAVQTAHLLSDQQLFEAVLQSSRVKESARWAAKLDLGLDKEHPGVPYRVESDGNFTLGVDKSGARMGGWPTSGTRRQTLIATVNSSVLQVARPLGTSSITVG